MAKRKPSHESEMALFYECSPQCARKGLDTADIVRDAMFRQLSQFPDEWGSDTLWFAEITARSGPRCATDIVYS